MLGYWRAAMSLRNWNEMGANPLQKLLAAGPTAGDDQNDLLTRIDRGIQLVTIEHEKGFERRMADALIAIDKGMIIDQRKRERGSL